MDNTNKKGQVTIFVLLAILIFSSIVLIFFFFNNTKDVSVSDTNEVYRYIQTLIQNSTSRCLQIVGQSGGYYKIPPELYVNQTAYWYYNGEKIYPTLEEFETRIGDCINVTLKKSLQNISTIFDNQSLKINKNELAPRVNIYDGGISIEVKYPFYVYKGESSSTVSDFKIDYHIKFSEMYELATKIVNYASTPYFDICNPLANMISSKGVNFTFFEDGDNLFVEGQTFEIFANNSRGNLHILRFAIKRPVSESFGESKQHLAILYEDYSDLRNFGAKSLEVFNNLGIVEGVDYYKCGGVEEFISKLNDYNIVVITGGLQYQIRESKNPDSTVSAKLLSGCNSFGPSARKIALKNWVNNGGLLWIGGVGKIEADDYEISYLGRLGYTTTGWEEIKPSEDIGTGVVRIIDEARYIVEEKDILQKENVLLTCPNDISKEIAGTWASYKISITGEDNLIIGERDNPSLWMRKLGNGQIVFDNFILKSNGYAKLDFTDDLYSKGLAEKYFANVLSYLTKFKNLQELALNISLISPLNSAYISEPIFYFQSTLGVNKTYEMVITDEKGMIKKLVLDSKELKEDVFSRNRFSIDLVNSSTWANLSAGNYEWQVKAEGYFSNIAFFSKE